ncbi:MAG TPA: response regulator transcription factor [Solirubrobacteraceae bacterium]|jgi:two-component system nitrate/nitrite response regulator NarL
MDRTIKTYEPARIDALPAEARVDDLVPILERIRVVIADDHPLYREAIALAIARDPRLELVGEAGDGEEAYALTLDVAPDVLLLDQRMPGLDGVTVCERLRRHDPPLPTAVLMLSAFDDADVVWRAVSQGAAGFIGKDASASEIREAIRRVAEGRLAFTRKTTDGVNQGFDQLLKRS